MTHELLLNIEHFTAIWEGSLPFLVVPEHNYLPGDSIKLNEWDGDKRTITVAITCIFPGGQFGIEKGYCVLGIKH